MRIYLIRHGEAAASWSQSPDPGLSERGQEEARDAAERVARTLGPDAAIVSSPLLRAQETAEPLAELLELPIHVDAGFREIPSPVPLAERQDWLRQFMRERWDQQSPELHRWRDQALTRLRAMPQPTAVFTHFLVINAVVGRLTGKAETLCCWPGNGSVTELALRDGALELVALGAQMDSVVN
ncbi:MAG: histidine phosphatase family protein [Pseudomonadota bacterium]